MSLVAHVDAGLGSRWRAEGTSPNGVFAVEPVTIQFSEHYPNKCPEIALRHDFDRSHPHLLPGRPDQPPRPCYIDGHPHDFLRLHGMHGVITQLADWLEKAAAAELIDPSQGWEPVRRDRLDDYVEVDADIFRALVTKDGGGAFFRTPFTTAGEGKLRSMCCHVLERLQLRENVAQGLQKQYGQIGIAVVVWPGRSPAGGELIAAAYSPETVTNVRDLFDRATSFGLFGQLDSQLGLIRRRLAGIPAGVPKVIAVTLLVRRPMEIIGQGSRIEILPYVIEVSTPDDLAPDSLRPVRLAAQREAVSSKLMAAMSGGDDVADRPKWTLLGAGSVGSKLALHLAREGKGPRVVIDSGLMRPHNYSRHGLLPLSRFDALNDVKAQALSYSVKMLGSASTGYYADVNWLASEGTNEEWKAAWPCDTGFLLDATGSPSVTDALCLPRIVKARPRVVETSLFAGGRIAYVGLEGAELNPTVQDLAAETYRIFAANETLRDLAFSSDGDVIAIGQGCSTVTARMSDSALSAPIPAIARQISELLRGEAADVSGSITIGLVAKDLFGQTWWKHEIPAFIKLSGDHQDAPSVRISKHVSSLIEKTIERFEGVETGGVLIGRFNETTNSFHIVDLIEAPRDSKFTPSLFSLGIDGLPELIAEYSARSHGALYPVGTWHNHLSDTAASKTDFATGIQLAFGQSFPAVILIRTPSKYHALVVEASDATNETPAAVTTYRVSEEAE